LKRKRKVLSRGQIRVDASRALAKLRQHLLVDLHGYTLEVARAAVIGGATEITLEYDADDLFISFDGAPIDQSDAARLLDYALQSTQDDEGARLRRLALAVNAALGLEPSFVDLYGRSADGGTFRVRFDPSTTREDEPGDRRARAVSATLPPSLSPGGQGLHVRRQLGWSVIHRFITGSVPREVTLLVDACRRLPIPLRVAGPPPPYSDRQAVVRAPLSISGSTRGFVEIFATGSSPAILDWCERGVRMLRTSLAPTPSLAGESYQSYLPVGGWVDADELPTNASRSALREDDAWVLDMADEARAATEDALRGLIHAFTGKGDCPQRVEVLTDDMTLLEQALGGFVCAVFPCRDDVEEVFRSVLDLPLLADAVGRQRSLTWVLGRGADRPLLTLRTKRPIPDELRPWAQDVMLLRGRVADRVLAGMNLASGAERLERASNGARARRAMLEQPESSPRIEEDGGYLLHERFEFDDGPYRGLHGEVALQASATESSSSSATFQIYYEGHFLESLILRKDVMPLPLVAAIAWDERLLPTLEYDGVERNGGLDAALNQVHRLAANAATALLGRLGGAAIRSAVRAALLTDPTILEDAEVLNACVWPSADGKWHSAACVIRCAEERRAVCFVRPGFEGPEAADRRLVLVLEPHEHAALPKLLGRDDVHLVPYEAGLAHADSTGPVLAKAMRGAFYEALSVVEPEPPILMVHSKLQRAFVAPSPASRRIWGHGGVPLHREWPAPGRLPVTIAIDDDRVVPSPMWNQIVWPDPIPSTTPLAYALFDALIDAIHGDEEARSKFVQRIDEQVLAQKVVRRFLCRAATTLLGHPERSDETNARLLKLDGLRVLRVLDARGRIRRRTITEVEKFHEGALVPFLGKRPGFETGDWHPVLVQSKAERALLVARFGANRVYAADGEIAQREAAVAAAKLEERVLALAPAAASLRPTGSLPDSPVVRLDGRSGEAPDGAYAFAMALLDAWPSRCELLYCGRPIAALDITGPIRVTARFDIFDAALLERFGSLSTAGSTLYEQVLHHAVRRLAELIVEDHDTTEAPWWLDSAHALELLDHAMTKGRFTLIGRALRTVSWPTIQGEPEVMRFLAKRGPTLYFGTEGYPDWIRSKSRMHELDRPVLRMPPMPAEQWLRSILKRTGKSLRDITQAAHRLQEGRAAGSDTSTPKLRGAPDVPVLRTSFSKVGVTTLSGELEIVRVPPAIVDMVDAGGASRRIACELPFPIHAILRSELFDVQAISSEAVVDEIAKAARRHLRNLTPGLEELPTWVRAHVRRVVCDVARTRPRIAKRDLRAPIFEDTQGRFHALDSLTYNVVAYTSLSKPASVQLDDRDRVLRLTAYEVSCLEDTLTLEDVTSLIRRVEQAAERRSGSKVPPALDAEVGAACMARSPVESDACHGEVGLIAPGRSQLGGITVLVDRRVLCRIDAGDGWPLVAVVNDDTARTNQYFDGLASSAEESRIRRAVREAADDALFQVATPPDDALASLRIDRMVGPFRMVGWVWLPAKWPTKPRLRLVRHDHSQRLARRVHAPTILPIRDDVPVEGHLMFFSGSGDIPWSEVDASLTSDVARLVDGLPSTDDRALPYRWNMALLGRAGTPPKARGGDGRELDAREVVDELMAKGALWATDQRGHVDGLFPDDAPAFVLRAGTPLVHVLRHRAKVHDLGGLKRQQRLDSTLDGIRMPSAAEPDSTPSSPAAVEPDSSPGFFQGLRRSMLSILEEEPPKPTAPTDPLALTFQALLPYLVGLPSELRLAYVQRGRLVRYDAGQRTVLVNRRHESLGDRSDPLDERTCIAIAAAAIAELTREHKVMSSAEERRAVLSLLGSL